MHNFIGNPRAINKRKMLLKKAALSSVVKKVLHVLIILILKLF